MEDESNHGGHKFIFVIKLTNIGEVLKKDNTERTRKGLVETKRQYSRKRKSYSPLHTVMCGNKRETGWSPIYCRR